MKYLRVKGQTSIREFRKKWCEWCVGVGGEGENAQSIKQMELPDGREFEGWARKVKALRSSNCWLQNSHRDVKYSIRKIVSNIVMTMYGVKGGLDLPGNHFVSCINV